MMSRSAMLCAALSVIVHLGGLAVAMDGQEITVAGGAAGPARLGNSFQDIAAGSAVSAPQPIALQPVPAAAVPVAVPNRAAPVADPVDPDPVAFHATPTVVAAVTPTQTIAGIAPVNALVASQDTVRPRPRPEPEPQPQRPTSAADSVAPTVAPRPEGAAATPPPAASPGPAEAERRGVTEGIAQGASDTGDAGKAASADAGNAAASNYPGAVMRKINRTRKPRVGARGTAIVGFEIAPDGGLVAVQLLRSSGEAAVDAAALDHLRRAAPFPAPPAGATRRFQVEYVSRG